MREQTKNNQQWVTTKMSQNQDMPLFRVELGSKMPRMGLLCGPEALLYDLMF